jgi:hypothetical protein
MINIFKNRIKIGASYILDKNNSLKLYEYDPVVVRVVKRTGFNKYRVIPVAPVLLPAESEDSYSLRHLDVKRELLTRIDDSNKTIVVRFPSNMPVFSDVDIIKLDGIVKSTEMGFALNKSQITDLSKIACKIALAHRIANIEV